MRILLCNDDSVHAWGLRVLNNHLKKIADVTVVAPLDEKSTTGHSLTIHKPLRLHSLENGFWGVSGSPADCVYVGIREVLKKMPDLVVSGINRGANLGQDVYYSGTVSAAREACILGLPAFAVSLDVNHGKKKRVEDRDLLFDTAAKALVEYIKKHGYKMPRHTLVNMNVANIPWKSVKGYRATRQGFRYYSGTVLKRMDHRGRPYFWIGGQYKGFMNTEGTDCHATANKYVSVTPVRLDCTDNNYLAELNSVLK